MKNKLFKVTLIATLVSTLFLVGCGNSNDKEVKDAKKSQLQRNYL
jgi:outer membrane murein-binding lipoprotein Lpp